MDTKPSDTSLDFTVFHNVVDGKLLPSSSGESYRTTNPSTLEPNPECPMSTPEDVNQVVEAARRAVTPWAEVSWLERRKILEAFADEFDAQAEGFAQMLVKEIGRPLVWARDEVQKCAQWVRGVSSLSLPENVLESSESGTIVERFKPVGVILGIVPWNFPLGLSFFKFPAALLTGNVFILKPSPYAPYCCLKMVELGLRFFPPGVFQALSGNDELGPWLTAHSGIDKISFTGSIDTGKKILGGCSKNLQKATLELGGNDPAIVCANVDIPAIIPSIGGAAFINSGQFCMAPKRVYVHESIYDEFLSGLVGFVETYLKVGDGFEEGTFIGPIAHQAQFERVKDLLRDVERNSLKVASGDMQPMRRKGYFIAPVIVDNPPDDSRVVVEEPFGPVLPLLKWSDEAEVIKRANATEYGLGASVWSRDMQQAERISDKLQAGNLWINTHGECAPNVAFSGIKQSGYGVELGVEGLKACCNVQSVYKRTAVPLPPPDT